MKQMPIYMLLLAFILLVACSPEQELESPTATLIPPTPTTPVTNTPLSPTATATATPLPTATPPPFTQGSIVFRWHPVPVPSEPDQPVPKEPGSGLYQAVPGATPNDWTIEPLLEDIGFYPQTFLSPDQTKLAILVRDESNTSIADFTRIHIYTFADGSLLPLGNEDYLHELSWLPDNQAVVYPQSSNIELARLDGSPPESLTNNSPDPIEGEPYSYIHKLVGSPDGSLLALDIESGTGLAESRWMPASRNLMFFDTVQNAFIPVAELSGVHFLDMRWSPDSQWLTFTGDQNLGLYVLNAQTHEIQQLVDLSNSTAPAWSPNSQQLAYTVNATLYVWDVATHTVKEVTRKDTLSEPAWSPDGSLLAASYSSGAEGGLLFIDPINHTEQLIPLDIVTSQVIWSPNGEWLTGIFGGEDQVGLYIVNRTNGESHFLLDTEGLNPPSSIMWLP